jgi:hypothetical protein
VEPVPEAMAMLRATPKVLIFLRATRRPRSKAVLRARLVKTAGP